MEPLVALPHPETRHNPLSVFHLSAPNIGPSCIELTSDDHEAIRYYRTSLCKLYHTKNPKYSVFSVMFTVAARSQVVMHMILALAGSEIDLKRSTSHGRKGEDKCKELGRISKIKSRALHHYSLALRLMADVVGQGAEGSTCVDLDSILTAVYLMLMYEQMFGSRRGLSNHLAGAAIIVRHHCAHLIQPRLLAPEVLEPGGHPRQQLAFSHPSSSQPRQISQYSARLLSRVALSDAAATSYGIGGDVIEALYQSLGLQVLADFDSNRLETFDSLDRHAATLYRNVWGESYPEVEAAEDVENRPVFAFYGACLQLRFMISQVAECVGVLNGGVAREEVMDKLHATIQATGSRFADLLEAAEGLSIATDPSSRFVTNLRFVLPHYHAVVLEFLRLTSLRTEPSHAAQSQNQGQGLFLSEPQRAALRGIMTLAVQAFRHEGDEAMLRIAQPLFMVALETDDVLHREWVLERFEGLAKFGVRFERARAFLLRVIEMQEGVGRRVDVRERFRVEAGREAIFVF